VVRAADADEYVGQMVAGKYRVEEMIGEGGMGKVYRAHQIMLDKPVVLKVLRKTLLSDDRTVRRFEREAKAASRLNHPNSISILDFGRAEDQALFIAMEYVQGKDLHQILSREWPLPEAKVVRIVGQVLSALADAHGAGVIHRDLKPENIMVEQRRNEPDFVKVLDFGIAKIQDLSGDEGPALTRAGFVCGTPEYMSPEQARGGTLDHRSDLYAVGVILYQLTTGLLPFESDSAVGFATKHLTEDPPPPSRRRPEARISPGMERLILKALSKDPGDRPQSAEGFRSELLVVDKERRQQAGGRRAGVSSPVLQPVPRRATPADQGETRVSEEPPWMASESTVRADPSLLGRATLTATAGGGASSTAADSPLDGGPGLLLFKIVTVLLVAVSVGLAGWYLYGLYFGDDAPLATPHNAPTPGAPVPIQGVDTRPPFEWVIARDEGRRPQAESLGREGDNAWRQNQLDRAATRYREAWETYPDPQFSLRMGQIHFLRNERELARGWWRRHLEDKPDSQARAYIDAQLQSAQN
jgi:serine/threonine protein kinase